MLKSRKVTSQIQYWEMSTNSGKPDHQIELDRFVYKHNALKLYLLIKDSEDIGFEL